MKAINPCSVVFVGIWATIDAFSVASSFALRPVLSAPACCMSRNNIFRTLLCSTKTIGDQDSSAVESLPKYKFEDFTNKQMEAQGNDLKKLQHFYKSATKVRDDLPDSAGKRSLTRFTTRVDKRISFLKRQNLMTFGPSDFTYVTYNSVKEDDERLEHFVDALEDYLDTLDLCDEKYKLYGLYCASTDYEQRLECEC